MRGSSLEASCIAAWTAPRRSGGRGSSAPPAGEAGPSTTASWGDPWQGVKMFRAPQAPSQRLHVSGRRLLEAHHGPSPSRVAIVHYAEISLKGGNRPLFLRQLRQNVERALADLGPAVVRRLPGRLVVDLDGHPDPTAVRDRIVRVCGVASVSLGLRADASLEAMKEAVACLVDGREFASFRISARRAFKTYPRTSVELNRELGAFVLDARAHAGGSASPRAEHPRGGAPRRGLRATPTVLPGPGGLPVGVSGWVAALLSGGIDSPVAAWRMIKRGCRVMFVHFHSVPYSADDLAERRPAPSSNG